ncbi:MAG: RNA pseudouridine synthase [Ichthyobacteriaceae bacterium]|nr:RNA pseudouridine synthase [Ichthyobacteriaceae bacterium]
MLKILRETKDYIVVNKPHGLITESNPYEDSLETQVHKYLRETITSPFLGVVHRLDRVTSGVVLFAKKKSALKYFNAQLEAKNISKTYVAIVENKPAKQKEKLNNFLRKDQKNKIAVVYTSNNSGSKPCSLTYKQIEELNGLYLLEIDLHTGRFHQIRAQLSFVGTSVYGDKRYGSVNEFYENEICLHAQKLKFQEFESDEIIEVVAEVENKTPWNSFYK